jgi:hypothetical protein
MRAYRLDEGDIEIPDGWRDGTINVFMLPSADNSKTADASLSITRDAEDESPDVEEYANVQLVNAAKNLNRYKLIGRRAASIDGEPSVEVDYTWVTPERIQVRQRQAYVLYENVFVIFTLTAKAGEFARHEDAWETVVSARFRSP